MGSRNVSPLPSPNSTIASRSGHRAPNGGSAPCYFPTSPVTQAYQQPIDRSVLQKSLKTLETLLVALDEYRDLSSRLAKVEKRLGKASKEFANSPTRQNRAVIQQSQGRSQATGPASGVISPSSDRPYADGTKWPPLPSNTGRNSARVSSMAQRSEQQTHSRNDSLASMRNLGTTSSFGNTSRPCHAHRQSLPALPASSGAQRFTSPPPSSSFQGHNPRPACPHQEVYNCTSSARDAVESVEEHPDICACEKCTARSYGTFETSLRPEQQDRGSVQVMNSTTWKGRRVSAPVSSG